MLSSRHIRAIAQTKGTVVLKRLDSPVNCVDCMHSGEGWANVANSGWCGLMMKCLVYFCAHTCICILYESDQRQCDEPCLPHEYAKGNVLLALWVCLGLSCTLVFSLLVPPYPGLSFQLWPSLNKPQLIWLKVLKETRKWRGENK